MSGEPKKPGTPVTQEWLVTIAFGYFILGPLLILALIAIAAAIRWLLT